MNRRTRSPPLSLTHTVREIVMGCVDERASATPGMAAGRTREKAGSDSALDGR